MRHICSMLGVALLTAGISMAQMQAATARDQFRDLRSEARQVRSAALYIDRLAGEPSTTWAQMDKQLNVIKPAQEAMVEHLNRLEAMNQSLTPAERRAVNDAKLKVDDISARTHELRAMLDQHNVDVKSPKFKDTGLRMAHDARMVAHDVNVSVTQTASR